MLENIAVCDAAYLHFNATRPATTWPVVWYTVVGAILIDLLSQYREFESLLCF